MKGGCHGVKMVRMDKVVKECERLVRIRFNIYANPSTSRFPFSAMPNVVGFFPKQQQAQQYHPPSTPRCYMLPRVGPQRLPKGAK